MAQGLAVDRSNLAAPKLSRQWKTLYAPIAGELTLVEELLVRELSSDDPAIDGLVKHAVRLGGKRLRPALLLLAAGGCGQITDEHVTLGAVVELIHAATLVHDDVLDEADVRRHEATLNARRGNQVSILVGDFLFTHAFALASSLETTYAARAIGQATNIVCEGELRQIQNSRVFTLSEPEYLDIIEAKTAELCACCCRLGAHYAQASSDTEQALDRFGRNLGIAFQIADDLLDLVGDPQAVGKTLGADLQQQKPTLPLIHLLRESSDAEREALVSRLTRNDFDPAELQDLLRRRGSLDYAQHRAEWFASQAAQELDVLPATPARDVLLKLAAAAVSRRD